MCRRRLHPTRPLPTSAGVRTLWLVLAALMVIGALVFGTYQVVVSLAHVERTETESFPLSVVESIEIANGAGSVRVTATDGDEIVVTADISDGLRATAERREIVDGVLELRASCPNFGSDFCGVEYRLEVPRHLDIVAHADNGPIEVTGMDGRLDLNADDGRIELTRISGPLVVSNDNGRITASQMTSPTVDAENDNGAIELEFLAPPMTVDASTDHGSVDVVVPDDGEVYAVEMDVDNGNTDNSIPTDPDSPRRITLQTDNGDITARTAP